MCTGCLLMYDLVAVLTTILSVVWVIYICKGPSFNPWITCVQVEVPLGKILNPEIHPYTSLKV